MELYLNEFHYQINNAFESLDSIAENIALQEFVLCESNTYTTERLILLKEEADNKVKAFFENIWNAITSAFNNFIEAVSRVFHPNKAFLEKNKALIAKGLSKDAEVACYNYNLDLLKQPMHAVTDINSEEYDTVDSTASKLFKNYIVEGKALKDSYKWHLRGKPDGDTPPKVKGFDLSIAEKYCLEYDTTYKNPIKNSFTTLKNSVNKAKTESTSTSGGTVEKPEVEAKQESVFYSYLFNESVVLEDTADDIVGGGNSSSSSSKDNNTSKEDGKKEEPKNGTITNGGTNDKQVTPKKINNLVRWKNVIKVYTDIFSAKMSISHEAYKAYFGIIKSFVKANGGDVSPNAENKPAEDTQSKSSEEQKTEEISDQEKAKVKEIINKNLSGGKPKDLSQKEEENMYDAIVRAIGGKTAKARQFMNKFKSLKNKPKK
jgi:hypothetical protein